MRCRIGILLYHTVNDTICSAAMMGPGKLRSLEGQTVELSCDLSDAMTINGVSVIEADIVASNGVIHIIDEMLIPNSGVGSRCCALGSGTFDGRAR